MIGDGLYVVVVEFKNEGPTVMEATSKMLTYEKAVERRDMFLQRDSVTRVAIARLQYETGNEMILPWGNEA